MIAAVTGILEGRTADAVIINVGGLSLRVFAPAAAVRDAGAIGDRVTLYTHLHVREDILALYGFLRPAERDFFEKLLGVSSVGPRLALSLLSALSLEELQEGIARGDTDALTRIPGVGKKTAARLILDLKGKLDLVALTGSVARPSPADAEVIAALTGLGFPLAAAQEAVRNLPADGPQDAADRVRLALRFFAAH